MKIESKMKNYEISLYNNINLNSVGIDLPRNNEKVIKKENKKTEMDLNNRIKRKSQIINHEQRNIQEKVSIIQAQELKAENLEKTLLEVKNLYKKEKDNEKQETLKEKIKIRTLSKQASNLKDKYEESNNQLEENINYIEDKEKIINTINDTLRKINKIKSELSKYKNKLMNLESELRKSEVKIEKNKDYINEEIIINSLDFIFIKEEIQGGIIIDIYL